MLTLTFLAAARLLMSGIFPKATRARPWALDDFMVPEPQPCIQICFQMCPSCLKPGQGLQDLLDFCYLTEYIAQMRRVSNSSQGRVESRD